MKNLTYAEGESLKVGDIVYRQVGWFEMYSEPHYEPVKIVKITPKRWFNVEDSDGNKATYQPDSAAWAGATRWYRRRGKYGAELYIIEPEKGETHEEYAKLWDAYVAERVKQQEEEKARKAREQKEREEMRRQRNAEALAANSQASIHPIPDSDLYYTKMYDQQGSEHQIIFVLTLTEDHDWKTQETYPAHRVGIGFYEKGRGYGGISSSSGPTVKAKDDGSPDFVAILRMLAKRIW